MRISKHWERFAQRYADYIKDKELHTIPGFFAQFDYKGHVVRLTLNLTNHIELKGGIRK